jgi:hypothetical protein
MPKTIAETLNPTQRRQAIAGILGRGLLRLRTTCTNSPGSCDSARDSTDQKALDVSALSDPHVSWLTQPRS